MKWILNNLYWIVPSFIAAVALSLATWSSYSAHVSKGEARRSREASERSAAAAEESARADAAMAELTKSELAEASDRIRQRPWSFVQISDFKHRATNMGETVYSVEVTAPDTQVHVDAGSRGLIVVRHGEYFDLTVMKGMGEEGDVILSWAETDGEGVERLKQRELF
ncbi:hypothetical protein [Glycomyces sp. NRRL B-16210]|uniref:hypothetical protein n=1 Tax=Glycomyces sp. NRRL B-16210 TaxID=1463821 RepID=UPI0004C122F7|nr:hypothetical protein [Glycomyces sp. NRRL B-16210]